MQTGCAEICGLPAPGGRRGRLAVCTRGCSALSPGPAWWVERRLLLAVATVLSACAGMFDLVFPSWFVKGHRAVQLIHSVFLVSDSAFYLVGLKCKPVD